MSVERSTREPDEHRARRSALGLDAARSHELRLEQSILSEIVAQLAADERSLATDLAAIRRECDELEQRFATKEVRLAALDEEITLTEDQSAALEIELDLTKRRADRAAQLVRDLERDLAGYRDQIATARSCFQEALRDMARIKHKLDRAASAAVDDLERSR